MGRNSHRDRSGGSLVPVKKTKPAVLALVYRDPQGFFRYSLHDASGKLVGDAEEGYKNRMYAGKVARQRYPGIRVSYT
jgi:hypothetical protein